MVQIISKKLFSKWTCVPQLAGLENLNLELDGGRIRLITYSKLLSRIYAPGDVNNTKMLAHATYRMGGVAAENAYQRQPPQG